MESGTLSEVDDSTNETIQEESLTPERANTPEIPPPIKIHTQNETIDNNRNDFINNAIKPPTFKNIQQAKKRLHAFSVQKLNQLPTSPLAKKVRLDEKIDDTAKKTPKKQKDPNEKAKAVIEEIEEIKRNEQAYLDSVRASIDKEHFKKIEKKSRNIRKRSPSIEKSKKSTTITATTYNNYNDNISNKEKKRYPKNWKELHGLELSFDQLNREFDIPPPKGNNDVSRQLLFELPSLPIVETKMKTLNREDRLVPFQYVRFTKCKPIISFSINFNTIKEKYPSRRTIFETIPKEMAANIEKLYSSSLKFKTDYNLKVRNWFPKSWIDYNSECKLLENSVGLSFLQSYTEDDDNEPTTTSINITNDIFNKNESSTTTVSLSNINNKNKDKKVVKKMKKKKKKKKVANDRKKRIETKKKQKKSKIKEKLKKKRHIKAEKHHHRNDDDDKIEENIDNNDITSINIEKIDEIIEMKENTQSEVNIQEIVEIKKDVDDEEEEERHIKTSPDTEDYHSHWESDDDLMKIKSIRPSIKKLNRSWESDEELFERSGNNDNNSSNNNNNNMRKQCDYNNLEIPLNLTNLITRKSINIINEENEMNNDNSNCKIEILKPVNLNLDLDIIKTDNNNISKNLENQYEEFIKAVSTDSTSLNQHQQHDDDDNDNNKELIIDNISNNNDNGDSCSSDTSTSSSSSSTTSSTSTSSDSSSTNNNNPDNNNSKKKKKKKKKYKLKKTKRKCNKIQDIFNEFDIPVPSDLPDTGGNNNVLPLPVPSPDQTLLTTITTTATNNEGVDLKKPFVFPTITIQSKKSLIDHSKLKLNDDSDSCDFTEKFLKKSNEIIAEEEDVSIKSTITTTSTKVIENQDDTKKINKDRNNRNIKREQRNHDRDRDCKHKNSTKKPLRRRYTSPLLRRFSPKRRRFSPLSPTLSLKQRHKSPTTQQLSRRRSISPSLSSSSRYRRSPRRKRTPSPLTKSRPTSSSSTTTTKRVISPINSPLDGFKKSVADSTISDDMLPQPSSTIDDYSQSPISTYNNNSNITTKFFDKCDDISSMMIDNNNKDVVVGRISSGNNNSPKRLSLDDRINQVLGLEKNDNDNKQQQQIDNYHEYNNYQYDQQYYGQYPQNYTNYNLTPVQQQQSQTTMNTSTKVVQIGNILQVVPTDEVPHNLIENKASADTGQKIVQVGNMLQIVPAVMQPTTITTPIVDNSSTIVATNITTIKTIETTPITPILNQEDNNQQFDENLMKQKNLERKAERERRRLERTRRRKEKEKKRKEREKRRQLKLKLKTENMIKKALQLEAETLFDDDDDVDNSTQWPPIQVVVSTSTDTPNKGILLTGGFNKIDGKKSVQFADGVRPGEGTSPSGGEELSSPPPKTKRHKKIKLPKKMKKKKIKVKVKRVQQQQLQENSIEDVGGSGGGGDDDNDEEYENLPPPSPPPGSPPPHVFPSRVKEPTFNNINPYIVANPAAYVAAYPRQPIPPPPAQMVLNRPPYMPPGSFHPDLHQTHNSFVGTTNHGIPSHH